MPCVLRVRGHVCVGICVLGGEYGFGVGYSLWGLRGLQLCFLLQFFFEFSEDPVCEGILAKFCILFHFFVFTCKVANK